MIPTELLVAGTAPAADNSAYPRVLNALLGTKFRVVSGYKESSEAILAMERGETSGFCAWGWSTIQVMRPDWLSTGKIRVLVQLGLEKPPEHPDIPLALDLAKSPLDRASLELMVAPQQFARPFAAPPGVPPARIATLRAAFDATLNDAHYLAEAARANMDVRLVRGEDIAALLEKSTQRRAKRLNGSRLRSTKHANISTRTSLEALRQGERDLREAQEDAANARERLTNAVAPLDFQAGHQRRLRRDS